MAAPPPDEAVNARVTNAVLATKMDLLFDEFKRARQETRGWQRDQDERVRQLEVRCRLNERDLAVQQERSSTSNRIQAGLTAIAATIAAIVGAVLGK